MTKSSRRSKFAINSLSRTSFSSTIRGTKVFMLLEGKCSGLNIMGMGCPQAWQTTGATAPVAAGAGHDEDRA